MPGKSEAFRNESGGAAGPAIALWTDYEPRRHLMGAVAIRHAFASNCSRSTRSYLILEVVMLEKDTDVVDGLGKYIDGKMKRYSLMFAVNGGAFAIAKLMADADKAGNTVLLGNLKLWHLALGAIVFTLLMVVDIYLWGQMMRNKFLGNFAFSVPGKIILIFLGTLLISAWVLVASG